jgi:hypothetical protein
MLRAINVLDVDAMRATAGDGAVARRPPTSILATWSR